MLALARFLGKGEVVSSILTGSTTTASAPLNRRDHRACCHHAMPIDTALRAILSAKQDSRQRTPDAYAFGSDRVFLHADSQPDVMPPVGMRRRVVERRQRWTATGANWLRHTDSSHPDHDNVNDIKFGSSRDSRRRLTGAGSGILKLSEGR
jgi:hypothetical protein